MARQVVLPCGTWVVALALGAVEAFTTTRTEFTTTQTLPPQPPPTTTPTTQLRWPMRRAGWIVGLVVLAILLTLSIIMYRIRKNRRRPVFNSLPLPRRQAAPPAPPPPPEGVFYVHSSDAVAYMAPPSYDTVVSQSKSDVSNDPPSYADVLKETSPQLQQPNG